MNALISVQKIACLFGACLLVALANGVAYAAEPQVVVTIKPLHSLVAGVMRGIGEPRLLIDGGGSPHTYALKPSDTRALTEAGIVFRVSETLETFLDRVVRSLPGTTRLATASDIKGLKLHALRAGAMFEAEDGHANGHSHGGHKGHGQVPQGSGIDGHIWLDPMNAKLIVADAAKRLAAANPEDAARIENNTADLTKRLDDLDREMAALLAPLKPYRYIVFHDAYQYLEKRYGLSPAGSVTLSPDVPASAKRISELRRRIATTKAACVFAEPQFSPRLIDAIIEGTPARRGVLDPIGADIPAGPDQYFALMRGLARSLKACLINPA